MNLSRPYQEPAEVSALRLAPRPWLIWLLEIV